MSSQSTECKINQRNSICWRLREIPYIADSSTFMLRSKRHWNNRKGHHHRCPRRWCRCGSAESRAKVHFHNRVKYSAVRLCQKFRGGLKCAWCLLHCYVYVYIYIYIYIYIYMHIYINKKEISWVERKKDYWICQG